MIDYNDIQIEIPARLADAVDASLREVEHIHRRRTVRRTGMTLGSFVAVIIAFLVFGFTNPAIAEQIPIIGRLFSSTNTGGKSYGTTTLDTYSQVSEIEQPAQTVNSDIALTLEQAYSDGHDINLAFSAEIPASLREKYSEFSVSMGAFCTAVVNGVEILPPYDLQMNGFEIAGKGGKYSATMRISLPPELEAQESYEISLKIRGLCGWDDEQAVSVDLPDEFEFELVVQSDPDSEKNFTSDAQDNGAKLLKVSATPTRTVFTIEQPYWGEAIGDFDVYDWSAGEARLYTEDGQELKQNYNDTRDKGKWDREKKEPQTYDIYFEGAPAGETILILRYRNSVDCDEILAEFTIDLENETVTAGNHG